ncbi:MAG: hypothetical protein FJ090_02330 [Deltaproteobacteria bacterium]|nr:hypothetical protein [Deltaproteobacteria bacterium]
MGGFAGVIGAPGALGLARRLGRVLDARGPASRHEIDAGDTALVVTSSAPGAPPVATVDGWTVAVDGPLHNLDALARELELDPSVGPAAVAAQLLARLGVERALSRLAGPVAVAAASATEGLVARDRAGERPLFLARAGRGMAFASEARALSLAGLAGPVEPGAVRRFVALGSVLPPVAWRQGALALAPATRMDLRPSPRSWREWTLPVHPLLGGGNRERWLRSVRFALDLAFASRARAAKPYAIAVSGGMASAALLAHLPVHHRPALALVLAGDEGGREAAARAGLPVKRVDIDVTALLDEVVLDAPVATPLGLATLALARAAWAEGMVGLALGTGHGYPFDPPGADWRARLGRRVARRPALEALLEGLGPLSPGDREAGVATELESLLAAAPAEEEGLAAHWVRGHARAEVDDALAACGAFGLEPVLPFVDQGVLQVATQVPCAVHHARGRRSLLAEVGGVASVPSLVPAVDWPATDVAAALEGWVSPDHARGVLAAGGAWAPRSFRLRSLAAWRAGSPGVG